MGEPAKVRSMYAESQAMREGIRTKKPWVKPEIRVVVSKEEKERRAKEKSDTSSVMSAEQARQVRTLEAKSANLKYEQGYAIDDKGKVISKTYTRRKDSCAYRITELPIGPYVRIHNHPNDSKGAEEQLMKSGVITRRTLAGMIGIPLSGADVANTITYGNKAVRANTPDGWVFQMESPKEKWGKPDLKLSRQIRQDWDSEYSSYLRKKEKRPDGTYKLSPGDILDKAARELDKARKAEPLVMSEYKKAVKRYLEVGTRINTLAAHTVNKSIAKKYGLKYTRRRETNR